MKPYRTIEHTRAYTLIEMIMVIVVVAILGRALLVKVSSVDQRSVTDQADVLRRNITHLQSMALTYGVALRLSATSNRYSVTCLTFAIVCAAPDPIASVDPNATNLIAIDPATGRAFSVSLSNVTLSGSRSIDFDSAGRPTSGATLIATNPGATYVLSSGGRTATVVIRPITGFAEVSY